jgi:hypothetical protein
MINFSKPKAWRAAGVITLGVAGFIFGLSNSRLQAQQVPSRQLVQANEQRPVANRRIALVIGNGAYTSVPPLKNPSNDARDMAATLKQLGFTVASAIDADQRTMKRLIREFGQQLKGGGQGVFYYAGHGVQMRGRNYLIPANADITSETDVEDQGVDLNLVLGLMDEAQNGLNIVILDACRNNPFTRSFRSAGSGLAQVDAPTGTLIAYATSPGRVAGDGQGRNGLYTSELLNQMLVSGISVEEMFKRVRAGVQKQTNGQQVPWESSSLVGNFYFATPVGPNNNADTGTRVTLDPAAFELSYWETIKNSTDANDYKGYLEKYPSGQFVTLARNRVASIEAASKPVESRSSSSNSATELAFWDAIKNSTNPGDFRAYLKKYPNGVFVELAESRVRPLEAAAAETEKKEKETFKGAYGKNSVGENLPGAFTISPSELVFKFDHGYQIIKECHQFAKANVKGSSIYDIEETETSSKYWRFDAPSPAEATRTLDAIKNRCNPSAQATPKAGFEGANNSLEGTTWKGDSAGGDKHYEFQFLANSEVIWSLKWSRLNDPTFRGTYTRKGDEVLMVFDAKKVTGGNEVVSALLSGDSLTGSWNFGRADVRPDNGMYKFTVRKVQ